MADPHNSGPQCTGPHNTSPHNTGPHKTGLPYSTKAFAWILTLVMLAAGGCRQQAGVEHLPPGDPGNGGLLLPDGFEAVVVVDSIGPARHLTVNDNGDIYVNLRRAFDDGGLVALSDTTNDGKADIIRKFWSNDDPGPFHTGIAIHNGHLYFSSDLVVYRYALTPGELVPEGAPDTLVVDDHAHGSHHHITKPMSFDGQGNMFIPFGAPSDVCQDPIRTPGMPGQDPCPELEKHGGIWQFDENAKNQLQADGYRYATGLRSIVAMDWNPVDGQLYAVQHGRDRLHTRWPNLYTPWESAMLPAEEFVRATEGSNFGWPFCYYDQMQGKKLLNPEYGGDGNTVGRCSEFDDPLIGFPGHFAPNDLMFYRGEQFPDRYNSGAFFAFHGSTIRNPYPQAGYFVAFVPFEDGGPSGDWEVFANGFAGVDPIVNTSDARYRPMGLATGPDGSLYISESRQGKIWRVMYKGDRDAFGEEQLAVMAQEKRTASNIRTPHEIEDNLERGMARDGESIYRAYCAACHQRDGQGTPGLFPPLSGTDWVTGDKARLVEVILTGWDAPVEVKGETYDLNMMPQHSFLSDQEVAAVATYIRQSFGNSAGSVSADEVREVREGLEIQN